MSKERPCGIDTSLLQDFKYDADCLSKTMLKWKHDEECAVIQATEGRVHLINSLALQKTFPKKKISDVEKESK